MIKMRLNNDFVARAMMINLATTQGNGVILKREKNKNVWTKFEIVHDTFVVVFIL